MVAGGFMLVPYLLRGAGGGDVKMLVAAGAIAGWSQVIYLLWYTSLCGIILAVAMVMMRQLETARVRHYVRCLVDIRYDRCAGAAELPPPTDARVRIPFGLAIAAGLLLTVSLMP
jgi:prepilin peptidase CpaA